MHAEHTRVKRNAKLGAFSGLILISLGLTAIGLPFLTGTSIPAVVGALMASAGLIQILFCISSDRYVSGLTHGFLGFLTFIVGLAMLVDQSADLYLLTWMLVVYFVVDGIVAIMSTFRQRIDSGKGWLLLSGICSLMLAPVTWYTWPETAGYAMGILVGVRLVFGGWTLAFISMAVDTVFEIPTKPGGQVNLTKRLSANIHLSR